MKRRSSHCLHSLTLDIQGQTLHYKGFSLHVYYAEENSEKSMYLVQMFVIEQHKLCCLHWLTIDLISIYNFRKAYF